MLAQGLPVWCHEHLLSGAARLVMIGPRVAGVQEQPCGSADCSIPSLRAIEKNKRCTFHIDANFGRRSSWTGISGGLNFLTVRLWLGRCADRIAKGLERT